MILILGGTTEGRIAARTLEESVKPFYYSTKGDEQEVTMHHGIRLQGAMDELDLEHCCREHNIQLLVDAAHPFAIQLHQTVEKVAHTLNLLVIRFERIYPPRDEEHIIWCDDFEDAIRKVPVATSVSLTVRAPAAWPNVKVFPKNICITTMQAKTNASCYSNFTPKPY